jgi:anthranilate synthase component 1
VKAAASLSPPFVTRVIEARPTALFDLHSAFPERYPALLESVARSPHGRFDLLLAYPLYTLQKPAGGAVRASDGGPCRADSILDSLDLRFLSEQAPAFDCPLPFTGGWLVMLSYETAGEIERRLQLPGQPQEHAQCFVLRIPAALIYDHATGRLHLVAETDQQHLLASMSADVESCASAPAQQPVTVAELREDAPQRFLDGVRRVQAYIAAGDVYQVNLSRGWQAELARAPAGEDSSIAADLYRALRVANPAPFAASVRFGRNAVLSSSPERLFSVRAGEISTRPIAGTRPRSHMPGADPGEKAGLAAHPKERAEHVMLIDLERNDLGRVCVAGSVRVDEFMVLESYEHVHHIVSNVRGRLLPGMTPGRILRAVFPGGTITGCPKVRCMQIIAELEAEPRGAYTGSLGYLNRDGSGDFNILIRTMTLEGHRVSLRAGAGIVADSDPERELAETRAKARGLLRALGRNG